MREPFQPSAFASASASRAARRSSRAESGASLAQLGSSMEIAMESRGWSTIGSIGRRSAVHPLVGLRDGRRRATGLLAIARIVGGDDLLDQVVAHHIAVGEAHGADTLDILDRLERVAQARLLSRRQVDLRQVTVHRHARILAQAGQKHLHLHGRGVLRLVQDDEGIGEGAAAHEGERRDLDLAGGQALHHLVARHHVVQRVVEWTQIRVDLFLEVAGQEAEALARLDRWPRQDDAIDRSLRQHRDRDRDRQIGLAGTGGADAEHQLLVVQHADVFRLRRRAWRDQALLGLDRGAVAEVAGAEQVWLRTIVAARGVILPRQADGGIDVVLVEMLAALQALIEAGQDLPCDGDAVLGAGDDELVAARDHRDAQLPLQPGQMLVMLPEQQWQQPVVIELQMDRRGDVTERMKAQATASCRDTGLERMTRGSGATRLPDMLKWPISSMWRSTTRPISLGSAITCTACR